MRVIVLNNMAPFVWGGAEELARHLCINLEREGHEAELLRVPFQWNPAERIPSQMLLARALEIRGADRVIGLKFPAYLVPHEEKVLWLAHQYRQAYDLYGTSLSNLPRDQHGDAIRDLIRNADQQCFASARKIFTISGVTNDRLWKFNDISAEVLFPPVNDPERFGGGPYEGYIFAGGRINASKRQHLLVEAMRFTNPSTRLIIAGPPDSPEDAARITQLVDQYNLGDRVTLDLRMLERAEYARYLNSARAVAYVPYDEDYGYVTIEAATAKKPVISTHDSGGVADFISDRNTGWLVMPTPDALASVLDEACQSEEHARALGEAFYEDWAARDITWPAMIRKLLQ